MSSRPPAEPGSLLAGRETRAPQVDFHDLLVKTSRTFALSIPVLEEPLRTEVGLAYLLFRIADTFEDAHAWPARDRADRLGEFAGLVESRDIEATRRAASHWLAAHPTQHAGYRELLAAAPAVVEAAASLPPAARAAIVSHVLRTCNGMARFVLHSDVRGRLELPDVESLRQYCYVVAGIVGELLTELFLLRDLALAGRAEYLRERAGAFGEALQLVNILKDEAADEREGRRFLPGSVANAEIRRLARADLAAAAEYVRALQEAGGSRGIVEFTALPLLLARETLERIESQGAGAKVSRERVREVVSDLGDRLDAGVPAV